MIPRDYTGFRVCIVGSCQAPGLKAWIERYLPGSTIDAWHVGRSPQNSVDVILASLPSADLIISQIQEGYEGGRLDRTVLLAFCPNVVFLPLFVFPGFHPDLIFRELDDATFLPSPVGSLHSALVAAAFELGIAQGRVAALFNPIVYEAAGFFDVFEMGRAAMEHIFSESGYDLSGVFDSWMHGGAFMHLDNHPHIRVLGTLARLALVRAGLDIAETVAEPTDNLGEYSVRWPIHRAVARRVGVMPSPMFVRSTDELRPGMARELTLEDFIAGSYEIYAAETTRKYAPHIRVLRAVSALQHVMHLA